MIPGASVEVNYAGHLEANGDNTWARLVDQTIEEMSELTQVLLQHRRGRFMTKYQVLEEMADVAITTSALLQLVSTYPGMSETYAEVLDEKITKCNQHIQDQLDKKKRGEGSTLIAGYYP